MNPKTVLLLGATGGIGQAIALALVDRYQVIGLSSRDLNLASPSMEDDIHRRLSLIDPDYIINAAGYFATNQEPYAKSMSVNFGSNWAIIHHYQDRCRKLDKNVKIVMIGSSAHKSGRRDYMLYSASKAAVFNLWQGARELFAGSRVSIDIINPVRTRTDMAPGEPQPGWLEPQDVAQAVMERLESDSSECIDMTYKD